MKYPRRVPWVDVEEFSAVFNSIFNSSDLNDNLFGVNRVCVHVTLVTLFL